MVMSILISVICVLLLAMGTGVFVLVLLAAADGLWGERR
jgi:hypothetical protein